MLLLTVRKVRLKQKPQPQQRVILSTQVAASDWKDFGAMHKTNYSYLAGYQVIKTYEVPVDTTESMVRQRGY
jgi:hypothetical protein